MKYWHKVKDLKKVLKQSNKTENSKRQKNLRIKIKFNILLALTVIKSKNTKQFVKMCLKKTEVDFCLVHIHVGPTTTYL